jgi:hypothetical protein
MTVGELVELQIKTMKPIIDTFNDPNGGIAQSLEAHRKISKSLDLNAVMEALRPAKEAMDRIKNFKMPDNVPTTLPSSLYGESYLKIPEYVEPVRKVEIVNPEALFVPASQSQDKHAREAKYTLPQNGNWESLLIQFVDGHTLKVSYPGMKAQYFDYKEMGFQNNVTRLPDLKWELLRSIADNSGTLTNAKWDRRFHRNIKYELNEGLKKFFGLKTPPIPHYTKRNGYQPLFMIK